MSKLWFETLDEGLTLILKNKYASVNRISHFNIAYGRRYERADNFSLLLKKATESYPNDGKATYVIRRLLPELHLAYNQFSPFDYTLIALAYGTPMKEISETNQFCRAARQELNKYFLTNDEIYVEQMLEQVLALSRALEFIEPEKAAILDKTYIEALAQSLLDVRGM